MLLHFGGISSDIIYSTVSKRQVFLFDTIVLYLHGIAAVYDRPILAYVGQGGDDSVHRGQSNISVYIRDPGYRASDTLPVICGARHLYLLFYLLARIL